MTKDTPVVYTYQKAQGLVYLAEVDSLKDELDKFRASRIFAGKSSLHEDVIKTYAVARVEHLENFIAENDQKIFSELCVFEADLRCGKADYTFTREFAKSEIGQAVAELSYWKFSREATGKSDNFTLSSIAKAFGGASASMLKKYVPLAIVSSECTRCGEMASGENISLGVNGVHAGSLTCSSCGHREACAGSDRNTLALECTCSACKGDQSEFLARVRLVSAGLSGKIVDYALSSGVDRMTNLNPAYCGINDTEREAAELLAMSYARNVPLQEAANTYLAQSCFMGDDGWSSNWAQTGVDHGILSFGPRETVPEAGGRKFVEREIMIALAQYDAGIDSLDELDDRLGNSSAKEVADLFDSLYRALGERDIYLPVRMPAFVVPEGMHSLAEKATAENRLMEPVYTHRRNDRDERYPDWPVVETKNDDHLIDAAIALLEGRGYRVLMPELELQAA